MLLFPGALVRAVPGHPEQGAPEAQEDAEAEAEARGAPGVPDKNRPLKPPFCLSQFRPPVSGASVATSKYPPPKRGPTPMATWLGSPRKPSTPIPQNPKALNALKVRKPSTVLAPLLETTYYFIMLSYVP